MRRRASSSDALAVAFGLMVAAVAAGRIGRGAGAEIWDDALFFRRVAYNVLHHGFAGWNRADGPVFMNTSQLYQAVTIGLLGALPRHFNAATVLWAAACTFATFVLLRGRSLAQNALALVGLSAPPILMAIGTGMDTCTVFVAVAALLRVALAPPSRRCPWILATMNVAVYLARPDAALLSTTIALGLLSAPSPRRVGRLFTFCLLTGAMLVALSAAFRAYYGTALPLATFLKVSPVSIYDPEYIALGWAGKLANLRQIGLVVLPLVPFFAMRLDRDNVVLVVAASAFLGFHALVTNEIMGYHARFYAPALPVLVCAAARGVSRVSTPGRRRLVVIVTSGAAALALLAYDRAWIEDATHGSYLDRTPLLFYLVYFLGFPLLGLLLPLRDRARAIAAASLAITATALMTASTLPRPFALATDTAIYEASAAHDADLVGLDTIRACFEEPLELTHSELGVPGVLLPESRIIDYTGLANPSVVRGRFDFERLCAEDQPAFVFRPHRSHVGLNDALSASPCLAARYTAVRLPRPSACPLFVRNDHVGRFEACAAGALERPAASP